MSDGTVAGMSADCWIFGLGEMVQNLITNNYHCQQFMLRGEKVSLIERLFVVKE